MMNNFGVALPRIDNGRMVSAPTDSDDKCRNIFIEISSDILYNKINKKCFEENYEIKI